MPGDPQASAGRAVRNRVLALVPLLLALVAYWPGMGHPFVYDDHGAIVGNRFLRNPVNAIEVLSLRTIRDPNVLDGQRPVLLATMFLDRAGAAEPAPWRHHATNMALHAVAVFLLMRFVLALGPADRARGRAFIAGLLFAAHPAFSEAVQLPSYREDLLVTVFSLLFQLAAREPTRRRELAAALLLAAAFGSKEAAAATPLLLVWTWTTHPPGRPWRERLPMLAGIALVSVVALAAASIGRPMQAAGSIWNGLSLRWPENVWTAPWLWLRGMALFIWPWPLSADHVVTPVASMGDPRFLAGAFAILAIVAAAWWLRRRSPLLALGLGWLVLAWAPVSNAVPLLNPFAERYLYFVAPGAAIVAGDLLSRLGKPSRWVGPLCAAYVAILWVRLPEWRSDEALWDATLRTEPRSARALTGIGLQLKGEGRIGEAEEYFRRATEANPRDSRALINLAILRGQGGDLSGAERMLREAVTIRPDLSEGWANLAVALELQGKRDEALDAAERARARDLLGRETD